MIQLNSLQLFEYVITIFIYISEYQLGISYFFNRLSIVRDWKTMCEFFFLKGGRPNIVICVCSNCLTVEENVIQAQITNYCSEIAPKICSLLLDLLISFEIIHEIAHYLHQPVTDRWGTLLSSYNMRTLLLHFFIVGCLSFIYFFQTFLIVQLKRKIGQEDKEYLSRYLYIRDGRFHR